MKGSYAAWLAGIAAAVARASEDPYCSVGAVVADAGRIVRATGYNGPPAGVELDWADREARRAHVIHAEANALRYVTPGDVVGGTLAVTHWPCAPCVNLASAYGIAAIIWTHPPDWERYPAAPTEAVARLARIKLIRITTRGGS